MEKKKTEKTYTDTALKASEDLKDLIGTLGNMDVVDEKAVCVYLTIIAQQLVNLNFTLSGIADYYMRCEKQFDFTTEEMTTLDVKRIIDEAKNTLDPKYRVKFKENQNGKD